MFEFDVLKIGYFKFSRKLKKLFKGYVLFNEINKYKKSISIKTLYYG